MNLDERIQQLAEQTHVDWPELQVVKPPFQPGDIVKVKVTGFMKYGVHVVTVEGEHRGLIHIKQVADAFILDLRDWFEIGEELDAEVLWVQNDGKIAFSTRNLGVKGETAEMREARQQLEKELERIRETVEGIVGVISPESQERMEKLIQKEGIFRFAFILGQVLPTFKADLSYYLMNEIEKKMRDGL